jgi:hypothetical protein
MIDSSAKFDGPIPGENYTSDTKNYPWHRPPEITDYDEAVEFSLQALTDPEYGMNYMSVLEAGYSVATLTDIFVTQGIGDGKWTPDFALLIAGPVARTLEIMAKVYGIKTEMGVDTPVEIVDPEYLAAISDDSGMGMEGPQEGPSEPLGDDLEAEGSLPPPSGFMQPLAGPAGEDEQMSMLGYGPEQAPEEEVL